MKTEMYIFLDKFFFVFHTVFIVFILLGWAWKRTRLINLVMIFITAFSWFALGIWYGFGYCFCTDWHYSIRMKLGHFDMPSSYVKLLVDSITGIDWNAQLVDILTLVFFQQHSSPHYMSIYENSKSNG